MTASRASRERSTWEYRRRIWLAAVVALAVHGGVYFTNRPAEFVAAQFGDDDGTVTVEVELIEQAPEPTPTEPPPTTPEPEPIVPPEPPAPEAKPDDVAPKVEESKPEPSEPPKPARPRQPTPPRPQASRAAQPAPDVVRGSTAGAPNGREGVAKGGVTAKATALFSPAPIYPAESRAAGEQGSVLLIGEVDATGRITSVSVQKSSGYPRLDRAAQEAFRRYKLKPAMRNGQPIPSKVEKSFRFGVR